MLETWGAWPLAPLLRLWLQKTNKKESTYLMFNIPRTKSSQQRKTARHCRTP